MNCRKMICVSILILSVVTLVTSNQRALYNGTYVPKLIQSHGYPIEIHEVFTEDGYVIELHRIPHGIKDSTNEINDRRAIILGHCIFCSSAVFVLLGQHRALAYRLADSGYDVWLLNSRGTRASHKHLTLKASEPDYWKFSWVEQGMYDVTAVIDYALEVSGQPQVDYIAFSMGAAQLISMLSEKPSYNKKIRTVIALAPALYMGSSTGFFPIKHPMSDMFLSHGSKSGDLQFPPKTVSKELNNLLSGACNPLLKSFLNFLCHIGFTLVGGNINGNVQEADLTNYFRFFPDTISLRALIHYTQMKYSAKFEKFNFGRRMNKKMYGNSRPPKFDLTKVQVPINVFYSYGDTITNYKDIERLIKKLPNVVFSYTHPQKDFSHMDFVWGENAPMTVYGKILERLEMDYS